MKAGLYLNPNEAAEKIFEKAALAERLGYEFLWVFDPPAQGYTFAAAAAVASKTRRVKVGIGLISPFVDAPLRVGKALTSLQKMYGDRFEVCVGVGDVNHLRRLGLNLPRHDVVMQGLLDAKREIVGTLAEQGLAVKVWFAGQGPKTLAVSDKLERILLNYASLDMIRWACKRARDASGGKVELGIAAPAYIYGEVDDKLLSVLKKAAATVILGSSQAVLKEFGLDRVVESRARIGFEESLTRFANELSLETVGKFSIFLSQSGLKDYVAELEKLGVEQAVFGYPQSYSGRTITDLAEALFH